MSNDRNVQLVQYSDIFDTNIANAASISEAIDTGGFRGLGVIVPSVWTAANIGFYGVSGADEVPLYDDEGNLIVISGIATGARRLYIAPSGVWALGAFPKFRLASLNTATGAAVNQGAQRLLRVVFLR